MKQTRYFSLSWTRPTRIPMGLTFKCTIIVLGMFFSIQVLATNYSSSDFIAISPGDTADVNPPFCAIGCNRISVNAGLPHPVLVPLRCSDFTNWMTNWNILNLITGYVPNGAFTGGTSASTYFSVTGCATGCTGPSCTVTTPLCDPSNPMDPCYPPSAPPYISPAPEGCNGGYC